MPAARARRILVALSLGLLAGSVVAQEKPEASGQKFYYDDPTKESVFVGGARLVYGDLLLTADEIRYNSTTSLTTASGHFVLTSGGRRLVADDGTYNLATKTLHVRNLRLGQFPLYLTGEAADGSLDELVFTNATVFFREHASYTPSLHAGKLTYQRGRIVSGEDVRIGLLGGHFIHLPKLEQRLDVPFLNHVVARLGYRGSLGAFGEAGLQVPVSRDFKLGADAGLYSNRGFMIGPSGTYERSDNDSAVSGYFRSGYINDYGDRKTDILGRPVPKTRDYFSWLHRQRIGAHFTLNGEFNYWSDSEILRDFRPHEFFPVQQPDSFLEAAYNGDNYVLSAFARLHPNHYQLVTERLPEVRFDLLPTPVPGGAYQRLNASLAVLEDNGIGGPFKQHSTRLDAYYGLSRPIAPVEWFTFTPVAGGRVTYYADATGGRDHYTRTIGEVGFDAVLRTSGTSDYKSELWDIDGLRHLFTPKLSYRFAPEAGSGRRYIPPLESRVFSSYLPPLSIADSRNLDDLHRLDTLRIELDNTLQTRDPLYGSRDLGSLNFSADYRFPRLPGERHLSDIHTELALRPAPWLRLEVYHRFTPRDSAQQELNAGFELIDLDWWSLRLSTHFLRHDYEEYLLDYRQRLNEVYDVYGRWRYDARLSRFNEQTYGLRQRLGQTWAIRYELAFTEGARRESSFGFNVEVELLRF